jgi:hypothetical protein
MILDPSSVLGFAPRGRMVMSPFPRVVSTGRRNTCVRSFCWDFNSEGFPWPFVEQTHHFV